MLAKDCLVVFSGGQDSTTCLYWAMKHYDKVHALTFGYGQRHSTEIDAARVIAVMADVTSHEVLHLPSDILAGTSPITDHDQKLEQYKDWQSLPGGLEKTYVPGRNALFLTIAANRAFVLGCSTIVTGICQEDSGGYPDCREVFRKHMARAIQMAFPGCFETPYEDYDGGLQIDTNGGALIINIEAPLMFLTKAQTVKMAVDLPSCYRALAWSHTAYDGEYPPTGHDHASLLRAKGFEQADVPDPLVLRAVNDGVMELPTSSNYQGDLSQWQKLLETR